MTTKRRNPWALRFERESAKPSLAVSLVASLQWMPKKEAKDLARLIGLASGYLEDSLSPPFELLPPEGGEA